MKRFRWFPLAKQAASARRPKRAGRHDRNGSTIVVVIALLLALTFLGIVGYTIGTQEQGNAEYFSDAAKPTDFGSSGPSQDTLFDWGLRQLIVGTRQTERQSAASRRAGVDARQPVRTRPGPVFRRRRAPGDDRRAELQRLCRSRLYGQPHRKSGAAQHQPLADCPGSGGRGGRSIGLSRARCGLHLSRH